MSREDVLEFVGGVLALLLLVVLFVSYLYIGIAIEQDIRCKNGATEYCIGDRYAEENY